MADGLDSGFWLAEGFEQALTIASDHAPVGTIQQHAAAQLIARKVYGRPQGAAQHPDLVHLILGQLEADGHRALLWSGNHGTTLSVLSPLLPIWSRVLLWRMMQPFEAVRFPCGLSP